MYGLLYTIGRPSAGCNRCHLPLGQLPAYTLQQTQIEMPEWRLPYPDVDAQNFYQTAQLYKKLMKDASRLIDALADQEELSHKMMASAQKNDMKRVRELVQSTGVQGIVNVTYNPDGIHFEMTGTSEGNDCCKLAMTLKWH